MRFITSKFINALNNGELSFFLQKVKANRSSLSLEIRDGYVNIYYKGGNLLKITQKSQGYSFHFDERYCIHRAETQQPERILHFNPASAEDYVRNWDWMMSEMDAWFDEHPKAERLYQHNLLVNNPSVLDIEYQTRFTDVGGKAHQMRFDMIMLNGNGINVVENKYGIGAVSGSAGLSKHYNDICAVLNDDRLHDELLVSMRNIAENKKALGLIDFDLPELKKENTKILFLLAGYNQRSALLKNERDALVKTVPADVLMMAKDEYRIDLTKAEDFFTYGN